MIRSGRDRSEDAKILSTFGLGRFMKLCTCRDPLCFIRGLLMFLLSVGLVVLVWRLAIYGWCP